MHSAARAALRAASTAASCDMASSSRSIWRPISAKSRGGNAAPSGVHTAANRALRSRNVGSKPNTPWVASRPLIRFAGCDNELRVLPHFPCFHSGRRSRNFLIANEELPIPCWSPVRLKEEKHDARLCRCIRHLQLTKRNDSTGSAEEPNLGPAVLMNSGPPPAV